MKESLFRKKSLDRISSPEEINDYIHVTNPPVWIFLISIVIFLAAAIIWGLVGRIETKVPAVTVSGADKCICYVSESRIDNISTDMVVIINDERYGIKEIGDIPVEADMVLSDYAMYVADLQDGEYVYELTIDANLKEGNYETNIVTESISAITLLWN